MKGRDNKMEKKKLSVSTGLCYAGGDVGCNIVFGMIGTLLTLFYTDYVDKRSNSRTGNVTFQML